MLSDKSVKKAVESAVATEELEAEVQKKPNPKNPVLPPRLPFDLGAVEARVRDPGGRLRTPEMQEVRV
jgi:hypothetical protein